MGFAFRILGPLEVEHAPVLGGPKPRALLARLLLEPNRVVPYDELIDAVWPEDPPERSRHAIQVYISSLRRALGQERIRADPGGYAVHVGADELDLSRFERLAGEGADRLRSGDFRGADDCLTDALSLWRGVALAEVGPGLEPDRARLEEFRLAVKEDQVEAGLALDRQAELVPELEALVRRHPTRERLRAQLMLAIYRSGRQAEALDAYRDARRVLVEELGLEPSAELRELEAAILRQDANLIVEPAELRASTRLPAPATPLIGRRREVDEVVELFAAGTRLVTLTGPGGSWKTRLALQAAHELAARFSDGVSFVGLAALRDPKLVLTEIATALGIETAGSPRVALVEHLRPRHELLLLDNLEQIAEAAPAVAALLAEAPGLSLLATSRRALHVYGEHEYHVDPLALEEEAVPLFLQRARAAGRATEAHEPVREVCLRLDCLPLAIELAAARTRDVSLDDLRATLPRLEAAAGGPQDVPDRQRTLRGTIAWSYDLLEPDERRLFEALGAFAGSCSFEHVQAVAGSTAAAVGSLVDMSLLRRDGQRVTMLETIRELAAEKLEGSGRSETVRRLHAETFLALAREGQAVWRTPAEIEWWDRLEADRDNLRAALAWLLERQPLDAAALVEGVYRFWYSRGYFEEGARAYERVLEKTELEETQRARLLTFAAAYEYSRRNLGRARTLTDQSLALQRRHGDPVAVARTLVLLGTILVEEGDHTAAVPLFEESVGLARAAGDDIVLGFTLAHLAHGLLCAMELGHFDVVAQEALATARRVGDASGECAVLMGLGLAALLGGDVAGGAATFAEALELERELREPLALVSCIEGIAAAAAFSGRSVEAARLLGAAQALSTAGNLSLELSNRVIHERALETLRAALDGAELLRHWQAGSGLTSGEIAAEAGATAAAVTLERSTS
ncbi:BTAD domain-containing putative transcriptional regulator [soil metagenome]